MKRVYTMLDIAFRGLTVKDYDCVYGVFGDEGVGKSTLLLWMLEYWLKKKREVGEKDICFIDLDLIKWSEQLGGCEKYDMIILDEGGRLSNKRSMSNLNVAINQAYQIIRGDNLISLISLPSLFDLDGFFTKRRMRGCFLVYKRGRVAYWSRERMRRLVALNQFRLVKNMWVVKPTFLDTFPKYDGILKGAYDAKKKEFMKDTRKELSNTLKSIVGGNDDKTERIIELRKEGKSFSQISKETGVPLSTAIWKAKKALTNN